ncbi:MAG TPA: NAD(P)H-binding protein [Cytophagales bacterium]|nr:NAD(P)H-binding protein [Cytophagales bacterium]
MIHDAGNKRNLTATLIGATGLIGGHLLDLLIADEHFNKVKVLVRRPIEVLHPKLEVAIVDFADFAVLKSTIEGSDVVFCAVGTTQKKVKGDLEAYRKVDFDIPVHAAQCCTEVGCPQFLLVSAIGASSASGNFYLKLKGQVEDAIKAIGLPSVTVFRPSMLLGRRQETRLGEQIGQVLMKPLSFLIPSPYKAIEAKAVARAMLTTAKQAPPGFHYQDYKEMMARQY